MNDDDLTLVCADCGLVTWSIALAKRHEELTEHLVGWNA